MNLIISFSARDGGNCDSIAKYISSPEDKIVHFRALDFHPCLNCSYECFADRCKYRGDDIYGLYTSMLSYDRVILIVPMYCGNPCSLYFIFNERCQDYFTHNDTYGELIKRLHIIAVYGRSEETPDFIPCFEKWFNCSPYSGRVLGLERHAYGQKLHDRLLDVEEVRAKLKAFLQ